MASARDRIAQGRDLGERLSGPSPIRFAAGGILDGLLRVVQVAGPGRLWHSLGSAVTRAITLFLTVATGFSGLVYEVAWQKCFATLLGSHSEATAAVLGIFLGGLSLGYSLFGRVSRHLVRRAAQAHRPPRLLLAYGMVEGCVGLWALLFPWLFSAIRSLSLAVSPESEFLRFGFDVFLSALLIGPPTVLMGGTIPLLTQALSTSLRDATRFHALVYGCNTAGAFLGALAAGLVLVPQLGIFETLEVMGVLNLAAGGIFVWLGLRHRQALPAPPAASASTVESFGLYAIVAMLLGFSMMAVQTVLIRIGGFALGASHFTFALVVAVFILALALGSFAVSLFERIPRMVVVTVPWALAALLGLLYPNLQDAPYYAHVLRTFFRDEDPAFYPFYVATFLVTLFVLLLPIGLSGATLPLLFHHLRRRAGDLGEVAGRLYSWNTIGNLLGALLGGYALLFWLDLHHVYRLAIVCAIAAATLLVVGVYGPTRSRAVVAIGAALVGVVAVLPAWDGGRLASGLFRNRQAQPLTYRGAEVVFGALMGQVIFYDDDPTTSVAVKQWRTPTGQLTRSVFTNGKSEGWLVGDYPTMALVGLIPCLLTDRCESAFVIGYGTGVTVGELAALDSMKRVVVAEISHGVIDAAPLFDSGNLHASTSPKVEIVRSDAYRALAGSKETFDLIASEPSNPWVVGVEMLFSREFLEKARARLRPGGMYAQWFHLYEIDLATLELALRTYTEVFDHVAVWYTMSSDLLLLGFQSEAPPSLELVRERAQLPDVAAGLQRSGIVSLPALLAHELLPVGVVHEIPLPDEVHTLFHPTLSHRASRAFFRGERAELPPAVRPEATRKGVENSLLRAHLSRSGPALEDAWEDVAVELCSDQRRECATALARWSVEAPNSARLNTILEKARAQGTHEGLQPEVQERLRSLFGDGPDGASVELDEAQAYTDLFRHYYYQAMPFRREALQAAWSRCRGVGCRAARVEAEETIGRLTPPFVPTAAGAARVAAQ